MARKPLKVLGVLALALGVGITLFLEMRGRAEAEAPRPAASRFTSFEGGGFSGVDGRSSTGGQVALTDDHAYTGRRAARASSRGTEGFQRVWYDVRWSSGTDVWYGAAYYIPRALPCWTMLARWDNYRSFGEGGDTGGVEVENGVARLVRGNYDGSNYERLSQSLRLPRRRWFWLEVHQRLSDDDGAALNEVYVDGRRVGFSRTANSRGRPVDNVRYGYSALDAECSGSSTMFFDDVSISSRRRGSRAQR
ncbi:MAG: hypothetical protein ACR2LY_06635 [Thermoleophilaceae bacterium]